MAEGRSEQVRVWSLCAWSTPKLTAGRIEEEWLETLTWTSLSWGPDWSESFASSLSGFPLWAFRNRWIQKFKGCMSHSVCLLSFLCHVTHCGPLVMKENMFEFQLSASCTVCVEVKGKWPLTEYWKSSGIYPVMFSCWLVFFISTFWRRLTDKTAEYLWKRKTSFQEVDSCQSPGDDVRLPVTTDTLGALLTMTFRGRRVKLN